MKEPKATLADSIPDSQCLTIEDIAEELGLSTIRTRQVVDKAFKEKLVQKLIKKNGRRILFAPQMVAQLMKAVESGKLGRFNKKRDSKSSLKLAAMTFTIPVFDKEIARLLVAKFKSEQAIGNFLKNKLEETVKPQMSALQKLEEEYQLKKQQLLSEGIQSPDLEINV